MLELLSIKKGSSYTFINSESPYSYFINRQKVSVEDIILFHKKQIYKLTLKGTTVLADSVHYGKGWHLEEES